MANSQQNTSFPEVEVTLTTTYKVMNWNYKIGSQTDKESLLEYLILLEFTKTSLLILSLSSYSQLCPIFVVLLCSKYYLVHTESCDQDLASDASAAPCSVEALEAILAKMKQILGLEVY